MTFTTLMARAGRGAALTAAILGAVALTAMPRPAYAIGPWGAVGIGLGAFALGGALAANPYYYPYYPYNPYYYPPAAYYPPAPYYGPHRCWSPYYGRWYAC